MNKYISEFIGTYGLLFFGTGAIIINDLAAGAITHMGIALAFGVVVLAMIYAFGEISGAHINPAVTIAFWAAGKFDSKSVLPYIIAQLAGALLASWTLALLFPAHIGLGGTLPTGSQMQSFILEIVLTFFLMLVILNVSTGSKEVGTFAGLVIGGVVFLEALVAGPICGASMNPARSISPAVISGQYDALWLYIIGPIIGALLSIIPHRIIKNQTILHS